MCTWPQSKEYQKFGSPGYCRGSSYLAVQAAQSQYFSWLPMPGMKGVQAANDYVSSPSKSQIGSISPFFSEPIPAQAMSPVRNTKSQGFTKLSRAIWLMTICPNGAKVPMSPNTAKLTSDSSVLAGGGDLKNFTSEKVKVSSSPTLQQYLLLLCRPVSTALQILPWKPICPTLYVFSTAYAFLFSLVGRSPKCTTGLLQCSGLLTHMTCISSWLLVNPICTCLCPVRYPILTLAIYTNYLSVTLPSELQSNNQNVYLTSAWVMLAWGYMTWQQWVNYWRVECPLLSRSQVELKKVQRLDSETTEGEDRGSSTQRASVSASARLIIIKFARGIQQ